MELKWKFNGELKRQLQMEINGELKREALQGFQGTWSMTFKFLGKCEQRIPVIEEIILGNTVTQGNFVGNMDPPRRPSKGNRELKRKLYRELKREFN